MFVPEPPSCSRLSNTAACQGCCGPRLASALWPCSSSWAPLYEPVPPPSAHEIQLQGLCTQLSACLGPLGLSSLKPFAWCESRRGDVPGGPCTPNLGDPGHLCHPHRWLRRASWLSGVWSGCSSILGRSGVQDPTSPWTRHPLRLSRMWDGCGRLCWTRRGHSLSGTAPCLPCATWVARRRLWPWLKVRLDLGHGTW